MAFFFVRAGLMICWCVLSVPLLICCRWSPLFTRVICKRGTANGRIKDLTTGGTPVGDDGNTGELAHKAADVSWVTKRALEMLSLLWPGPEDERNTFRNFDFKPEKAKVFVKRKRSDACWNTLTVWSLRRDGRGYGHYFS